MNKIIYGCDTTKKITTLGVRDAIIQCFIKAHAEILEMMKEYHEFKSKEEFEEMKKLNIKLLITAKFNEIGADFDNPTKDDLITVITKLAEFATNFRKPEIIKKHTNEITALINKL